jgi:hypothetical protein
MLAITAMQAIISLSSYEGVITVDYYYDILKYLKVED